MSLISYPWLYGELYEYLWSYYRYLYRYIQTQVFCARYTKGGLSLTRKIIIVLELMQNHQRNIINIGRWVNIIILIFCILTTHLFNIFPVFSYNISIALKEMIIKLDHHPFNNLINSDEMKKYNDFIITVITILI